MQAAAPEDEDLDLQVRIALLGTGEEKERAVHLLFRRYERPVMGFLAERFADLSPDERVSVLHDTFLAIYEKGKAGSLDLEQPLTGLLFTIAKRRGVDERRKNSVRVRADVELTEVVGDYLVGTETGRDWSLAVTLGKAAEVCTEFRQFVRTLKGRQRSVASILADCLPDWLSDAEIAHEVFTRTGESMTTMEAKGVKGAMMKKFRTTLKQKLL